jgi:hypothetical protein
MWHQGRYPVARSIPDGSDGPFSTAFCTPALALSACFRIRESMYIKIAQLLVGKK